MYTFPKPPTPILLLAKDSKSSLQHSFSYPDNTEGLRNRILLFTLLTLDFSSGGTSIGTICFFIDLNLIYNMARNSAPESLVKYETPILVSSSFKVGSAAGGKRPLAPIAEKLG